MDAGDDLERGGDALRRLPRGLVVLDAFWPGRRPYLFDGWCRRS